MMTEVVNLVLMILVYSILSIRKFIKVNDINNYKIVRNLSNDVCIYEHSMFGYSDPNKYQCIESSDIYPYFDIRAQNSDYVIWILLTIVTILFILLKTYDLYLKMKNN